MRPHIEVLDSSELSWHPSSVLAHTQEKILSSDGTGACTTLIQFPSTWTLPVGTGFPFTEIFVLRGSLLCRTTLLTAGCYSFLPTLAHPGPLQSKDGALIFATSDPLPGEPIACLDTMMLPWQPPAEGSASGLVIKTLRSSDHSQTFLAGAAPLWYERAEEVHASALEEAFLLRGDCLMGKRGIMKPGGYFWRPPGIPHGPIGTARGGLWFFRSFGDFTLERLPSKEGMSLLTDYFTSFPLFDGGALG